MLRFSLSRGGTRLLALGALVSLLEFGLGVTLSPAQDDPKKAQDDAKKAIDDFRKAIAEAKNVHEKATAIALFGEFWPKDSSMVAPLAPYLAPRPGDINFLLPVTTIEALSKFRNNASASQALISSMAPYEKNPYVYDKVVAAIGKVGHESALQIFDKALKGKDANAAVAAIWGIADMPGPIALETLFKEWDRIEKATPKASAEMKAVYDKTGPEILKAIKKVSGEPWTTMQEYVIWWKKRGQAWRDEAIKKEKERASAHANGGAKPVVAPPMIVELLFKENGGATTANSGASSGMYPSAAISTTKPIWSATAPPNGGPSSLDFGAVAGAYAVDLGVWAGLEHLRNLKSFTITGWINCRSEKEAPGDKLAGAGNRILSWLNHGRDGVEVVFRANGALQVGINQWAEPSAAVSAPGKIPLLDDKAKEQAQALSANWRFIAVTYDSTVSAGHVKFYFGTSNADAKLDSTVDCARGPVGSRIGPSLTVGNATVVTRPMAPDRNFKGLIDEIRIFGSTVDGSGALELPHLIKVQNRVVAQN